MNIKEIFIEIHKSLRLLALTTTHKNAEDLNYKDTEVLHQAVVKSLEDLKK